VVDEDACTHGTAAREGHGAARAGHGTARTGGLGTARAGGLGEESIDILSSCSSSLPLLSLPSSDKDAEI